MSKKYSREQFSSFCELTYLCDADGEAYKIYSKKGRLKQLMFTCKICKRQAKTTAQMLSRNAKKYPRVPACRLCRATNINQSALTQISEFLLREKAKCESRYTRRQLLKSSNLIDKNTEEFLKTLEHIRYDAEFSKYVLEVNGRQHRHKTYMNRKDINKQKQRDSAARAFAEKVLRKTFISVEIKDDAGWLKNAEILRIEFAKKDLHYSDEEFEKAKANVVMLNKYTQEIHDIVRKIDADWFYNKQFSLESKTRLYLRCPRCKKRWTTSCSSLKNGAKKCLKCADKAAHCGTELDKMCAKIGLDFCDDLEKIYTSNDKVKAICKICATHIEMRKRNIVMLHKKGLLFKHILPHENSKLESNASLHIAFDHFFYDISDFEKKMNKMGIKANAKHCEDYQNENEVDFNIIDRLRYYRKHKNRLRNQQLERLEKIFFLDRKSRKNLSDDEKIKQLTEEVVKTKSKSNISRLAWMRHLKKKYIEDNLTSELVELCKIHVDGFTKK